MYFEGKKGAQTNLYNKNWLLLHLKKYYSIRLRTCINNLKNTSR